MNLPFVSVCTPTYNRRAYFPDLIRCFDRQDFSKDRMEWIILDDGDDKIGDLVADHPQVKYYPLKEKLVLGKKRNAANKLCTGEIIVYMDDDDFYPTTRVSHAVQTLLSNPEYLIAGSSVMYLCFEDGAIHKIGPYWRFHATANTFAFRRELLDQTSYDDHKAMAEESGFLKDYTIQLIQLDPMQTVLCMCHGHNTYDKRRCINDGTRTNLSKESF